MVFDVRHAVSGYNGYLNSITIALHVELVPHLSNTTKPMSIVKEYATNTQDGLEPENGMIDWYYVNLPRPTEAR
jgi:hypothetical protein